MRISEWSSDVCSSDLFLDELLHATERADGGAGVDGADAAGVACAPRLQEIEGFSPAHLTDRDAVWAKTERGADKIGERRDAIFRPHRDKIGRCALQLARILDQHDAVGGLRDLG